MKKLMMVFLMSAAWYSPASAAEKNYCHPSTGNWLNAAPMDCAPSGKNDTLEELARSHEAPPPPRENEDDGKGDQDDGKGDQDDDNDDQDDGDEDGDDDEDDGKDVHDNGDGGDQDEEGNEY